MNSCEGKVLSVGYEPQHRFSKQARESITFVEGHGVGAFGSGHSSLTASVGRLNAQG
jgi:hypothetical protein